MGNFIRNRLAHGVTVVSNEFIDNYMARANGEYVKVYLYILRNGGRADSVADIADALNHTEADVRRALVYWEQEGVLELGDNRQTGLAAADAAPDRKMADRKPAESKTAESKTEEKASAEGAESRLSQPSLEPGRKKSSGAVLNGLSRNEEFSQLLYIAQKYLNRTFTPTDCDVFAYLYGQLHMPAELLEYLVESCAQNGHTSIRYIEKVGLSWHERGFKTAEEAKTQSMGYKKDIFAVMRAFGLSGRNPADSEIDLMDKWFGAFGFTREIVVEACSRTMAAIHKPSFQYADTILTDWSRAGVRTMKDVEHVTRLRREKKAREGKSGSQPEKRRTNNRFHNLEEHGYNYDEMIWSMINSEDRGSGPGQPESTGGKHGAE